MLLLLPLQVVLLIMLLPLFAREQILGEDQRPLVVRKGKKIKEDHPKREVPPDAPIIDVSWDIRGVLVTYLQGISFRSLRSNTGRLNPGSVTVSYEKPLRLLYKTVCSRITSQPSSLSTSHGTSMPLEERCIRTSWKA